MRLKVLLIAGFVTFLTGGAGTTVRAETATISGQPSISVEVPAGFESSKITRGVQIKTPDDEVLVWFELFAPRDRDTLIKEHDAYWKKEGVTLGPEKDSKDEADGHTIIATAFNEATWKGKPTVVRYLFIDGGFPSKELILMSMWASPEGDKAHDADISAMIKSIDAKN